MTTRHDLVVIGGGVVGLALADAWLSLRPDSSVVVLEKEAALAEHASGRNSGVIHAGFYYAPDTLKAKLTRRGNQMLRDFCAEESDPVRATGKVVVTRDDSELPALHEFHRRGLANGVDLTLIDENELSELEPLARTHRLAIWSPTTSVAAPRVVVEALADRVRRRGGSVRTNASVDSAEPGRVHLASGERVNTNHTINAAGLHADVVARWFGVGQDYKMLPFKGLYWYGDWEPGRLQRHVYPVPDPRNPFLGVHLTVTVDGHTKIGPTAIPALWREEYEGLSGFRALEMGQILATYPQFLRSPHHDVAGLIKKELPKYRRTHLIRKAIALVPSVREADFTTKGRPGIRAQLLHVPSKRLEMDFVVRAADRSTHILNAVSPGWTSALAFAEYVVAGIDVTT